VNLYALDIDDAECLCCGAAAAEDLIRITYGVNVSKALNPLNRRDFDTIVGRLTRALIRATAKTEAEILRKAMDTLDVDWPALTVTERNAVIEAATVALGPIPSRVIPPVTQQLEVRGPPLVSGTKRGVKKDLAARFSSKINVSLNDLDKQILGHMTESQALFITDEYGRRIANYSRTARSIVSDGVARGLGRDEIARTLESRLGVKPGLRSSRNYWNVIASTFANRSRVWGHLSSFQDAAIERYVFEAVLDERTTDQCAALHGRTFQTEKAVDLYRQVAAAEDPQEVKDITPWIRTGRDPEGNQILFTQNRAGERSFVAQVTQSRVGTRDGLPELKNMRTNDQLAEMGLVMPPLHGRCRSTIIADV
jgi:SPP1 gp7 family putative phage head morphogenesis protein